MTEAILENDAENDVPENNIVVLPAQIREEVGTGPARELRRKGMVPATIYANGKKPMSIAIEEKEITKYYRKPQYMSQLFEFEIGKDKYTVLPKAIELNPITEIVRHADFVFLEKKMQKMEVPIVYTNKNICAGIKKGGYFNTVKRLLKISCPIDNLPRKIEVDTSDMPIGYTVKAGEVNLPDGAKILIDSKFVIASIIGKKGKADNLDDETSETAPEAETEEK